MSVALWILTELIGATIILLAGIYVYYKYYAFNFWKKRGVLGPEPSVPMGNMGACVMSKCAINEFFADVYEQYKDQRFCGIYTFFRPTFVVNDLDMVKDVLTKEFSSFHDRGAFCNEKIDPLTGHLFLLPGKKWRNLRVRLTPTFTSGKIKQMFSVLKECGDSLGKYLESKAQARQSIEIKEILARHLTDIIMSTAFGTYCNVLENPDNEFRYWSKRVFRPMPLKNMLLLFVPQFFDFFSVPYTEKGVTKFFIETFRKNVEYRASKGIVRKDFMDLLIQLMNKGVVAADNEKDETDNSAQTPDTTHKFTMEEAAAQAFVFFVAGFETSSTATTFCLFELALNQDIQDKLRQEIRSVLQKHGELTYKAVNEMDYLHKVVSETFRKHAPVGVLNRICTKEIEFPSMNLRIPEGTLITIPVHGIHRDPQIYPDPDKFDPERFSAENIAARHPYAFLPFGEGPRICIGARFGLVQVKLTLISVLRDYKVRLSPETANPPVYARGLLITVPRDGVHLIIEPA